MDLRGQYLLDWVAKNRAAAAGAQVSRTASLLPVEAEEVDEQLGAWLDLVTGNEIDGPNPAWHAAQGFEQLFPDEEDEEEDSSERTFAPA